MNTRTRPERNLEKLEHEPEKCDWKTTDTQKMRSRKCRAGPSGCAKWPPSSAKWVSNNPDLVSDGKFEAASVIIKINKHLYAESKKNLQGSLSVVSKPIFTKPSA